MLRIDRVVLLALALFSLLPSVGKALPAGYITLVNGTPYNWKSSALQSDQMLLWDFPEVITAGSTAKLFVVWLSSPRGTSGSGAVTFTLEGTGLSFQLQATAPVGLSNLSVKLNNFSTLGHPAGSFIDLGWIHDGLSVNFILAGEAGSFTSTRPPDEWMHENLGLLGNRSLRQLCIPGSHDAGMDLLTSSTSLAHECNTVTQTKPIYMQLVSGVRYFDIRPVIHGGRFYAGHYGCNLGPFGVLGCQGGTGESLDSIIKDVNSYTATHQELVVLRLSHDLNTDIGYPNLTQDEWNRLLTELKRLNNRFMVPNPTQVDLTKLTLRDFIGIRAAVVVVAAPENSRINLSSFAAEGFYGPQSFPVFDAYSNTDDLNGMQQDQLTKLQAERLNPDAKAFLLSWTLTLTSIVDNGICSNSILNLAALARPALYQHVLPVCNRWTYPNILYVDAVEGTDIAALAMAVNSKASSAHGYVIYKGFDPDTSIYVAHTPDSNLLNGGAWSLTRMNPTINTSATPAAVSFAGSLYVLYKGAWNDTRIFIAQPPPDGNILDGGSWNEQPLNPAINTSTAPAAAVLGNTLYMLYKGAWNDDNVYIARSSGNANVGDGRSWSANRLNPAIKTTTAPVTAAFNGSLYLFYKGEADDPFIYVARSTRGDVFDGNTWSVNRLNQGIGLLTSDAPGVVVYKGTIYMFYKGYGNDANIWVARSTAKDLLDGTISWTYTRLNPGINTTAAPKPVVVGDSLYLFYKGLESNIWIAQPQGADLLNGNAWRWERLNSTINTTLGPGAAGM